MRPYYHVQEETWKDCFSKKLDTSKSYLSLNSDYGKFVSQYLKYPTLEELILYAYRKYSYKSKVYNTLPINISFLCQSTLDDFIPVIKDIKPEEFAKLYQNSAPITIRTQLEKS